MEEVTPHVEKNESGQEGTSSNLWSGVHCDDRMLNLFIDVGGINKYARKHPQRVDGVVSTINRTASIAVANLDTIKTSLSKQRDDLGDKRAVLFVDDTLEWNNVDGVNKLSQYIEERSHTQPFCLNAEDLVSSSEHTTVLNEYLRDLGEKFNEVSDEVTRVTKAFDPDGTEVIAIDGRVKYTESILGKLEKKAKEGRHYTVGNMTDLIGMRIIVAGAGLITLENLTHYIQNHYQDRILEKCNKYMDEPGEGSYHAIHYIIKSDESTCFELQINTEGSRIISDVIHDTTYKKQETSPEDLAIIAKYHISNLANEFNEYEKCNELIAMLSTNPNNSELMAVKNPDLLKYALKTSIDRLEWTAEEKERVASAISYAEKAHGNDKRLEGTPYAVHPFRIAMRLLSSGSPTSTTIILSLLHDVIEDGDIDAQELSDKFGKEILSGLELLSKKTPHSRKTDAEYFSALMEADDEIKIIKVYDRIDNLYSLNLIEDDARKVTYLRETEQYIIPLAQSMNDKNIIVLLRDAMDSVILNKAE